MGLHNLYIRVHVLVYRKVHSDTTMDLSAYVIPPDTPISKLEAREAFEGLSEKEKHYCHFLSRASWEGSVICLLQTSPESAPIFLLLKELFSSQSIQTLREATADCVSDEEFKVAA